MKPRKKISGRNQEQGIILTLVAVFMLAVVGAMAALSIDVVTLYTARSEAQLAADGAALAGARVLANSGMTSDPGADADNLMANAQTLARAVAIQVAQSNLVGGRAPVAANGEVVVTTPCTNVTNPCITVLVKRTDLPTFFARVWGSRQLGVSASATAEAYNPSGAEALDLDPPPQVAPTCVKPWLLPNRDPTGSTTLQVFNPVTGAIVPPALLGGTWSLQARCSDCSGVGGIPPAAAGQYYPGTIEADDFPVPTALPACSVGFNLYQLAVAGCVPRPIRCGPLAASAIDIDVNTYTPNTTDRDADTLQAAKCLIHYTGAIGDTDSISSASPIPPNPFQFLAGKQNPVAGAVGKDVLVSDSLVTIPVINTNAGATPGTTVTVIGFLQVFLNSTGGSMTGPLIPATVVNLAGCGTGATGTPPLLGNGGSPVIVRLISPP